MNLSLLSFEIHLSRNPLVQIMNIVFPLFTLNLIVLASLFMESDTAGRIGLGTTAVLSYTVLLLIVMEKLPASSTRMPFIGGFFYIPSTPLNYLRNSVHSMKVLLYFVYQFHCC